MQDKNINNIYNSVKIDGVYDLDDTCLNCDKYSYNKPVTFNYYIVLIIVILLIR